MTEKRKFHRVTFSTRIILSQNEIFHHGRLDNISKCGALVRLEPDTHLMIDCEYNLSVYLDGEKNPLQFRAKLVNISFGVVGIKFVAYDSETGTRLDAVLTRLSSDDDRALAGHPKYSGRLAVNFQEG